MGAEESVLKSVEVGEPLPKTSLSKIWTTIAPARRNESQQATVFIKEFGDDEGQSEIKKFLECGIQTLKSLRHPRIVKYLDGSITESCACLIAERLRPLEYCLDDGFEKDEILSGLCDIFDAVSFLHEKAGLSHNNIGLISVFISSDGIWKLGSFECAQKLENCVHWCQTDFAKQAKDDNFIPPEDQKMMFNNVPVHARDVYGLGKLVECLMPHFLDTLEDDQRNDIACFIQSLTTEDASKRPPLHETNWKCVLRNGLYEIGDFFCELPLKTHEEKAVFFSNLIKKLETIPQRLVARRLSRQLLSRYVLLEHEAVESFLPKFVTYHDDDTGLLSAHLFKQLVVPELRKVFCVRESAVRLALLRYFDRYCHAFDEATLVDLILPELLLGMKDSNETIVASSMRCLADLVPLLGAEAVTGLKHMKYFSEGRPRAISSASDLPKLTSVKDAFGSSEARKSLPTKSIRSTMSISQDRKPSITRSPTPLVGDKSTPEVDLPTHPVVTTDANNHSEDFIVSDVNDDKPDLDWLDWEADDSKLADETVSIPVTNVPSSFIIQAKPMVNAAVQFQKKQLSTSFSKPLGAEFDIKTLDISTKSVEDDLFADLAPKITPTSSALKVDIDIDLKNVSSSKFQAIASDDPAQDEGWDDAKIAPEND